MENKNLILKMLFFTCILFAPLTFVLDILIGFIVSNTSLLSLGATFVILIIDFAISAFIIILRENPPKILQGPKLFYYSCGFYTLLTVLLKVIVTILNLSQKIVWNTTVFSIILIFAFSLSISSCILYLKPKSNILKIAIYFLVIGVCYYLLTITIGALDVGNNLILILSSYVAIFAIVTIIITLIKAHKKKKELDSKPYQKQF